MCGWFLPYRLLNAILIQVLESPTQNYLVSAMKFDTNSYFNSKKEVNFNITVYVITVQEEWPLKKSQSDCSNGNNMLISL